METLKASTAVVGYGPRVGPNSGPGERQFLGPLITATIGSCILFQYGRRFCVVTCRHVIESCTDPSEQFKAVLRYRNSSGGWAGTVLGLDDAGLRYHPNDSDSQTFDIAVFGFPIEIASRIPFKTISFSSMDYCPQPVANLPIRMWGYPVSVLSRDDIVNPSRSLPLKEIRGKLAAPPRGAAQPTNLDKNTVGQFVVEIDEAPTGLDGMSGGLVLTEEKGIFHPIGMAASSGTGTLLNQLTGTSRKISMVGFVSFPTIFEAVQS